MPAPRTQYNIVGRYINEDDARDIVGYHLRSLDGSKQGRYSIEQIAFLIGKDQIVNCTAQLYKDKVLFRGKGISLDSLTAQKIKVNKPNRVGDRQQVLTGSQKPVVQQPPKPRVTQPVKPVVQPPRVSKVSAEKLTVQIANIIAQRFNLADIVKDINPEDTWGQAKITGTVYEHDIVVVINVRVKQLENSESTAYSYEGIEFRCTDIRDFRAKQQWYMVDDSDKLTEAQIKKDINAICNKMATLQNVEVPTLYNLKPYYKMDDSDIEDRNRINIVQSQEELDNITGEPKSEDEVIAIYTRITARLMNNNFESAYNNQGLRDIPVFRNDKKNIKINIDFTEGKLYYISINIWGFRSDTMVDKQRDKMIVSESTMYLLKKESPEQITNIGFKSDKSNYKRAHYHDVVIKARQFKFIPQFKWLKINYLKINDEVFQGKLKTSIVLAAYNYHYNEVTPSVYNDASAFHWSVTDSISFNGNCNNVQGKIISNRIRCDLIHEMCHEYADAYLGGNVETDRNKWGDVLFGMKAKDEDQIQFHGEKFGKAVEFAASNCEFTFEQIFGYGLRSKNQRIKESSNERFGNEQTTSIGHMHRYTNYTSIPQARVEEAKQWYQISMNNIMEYLKRNLNLQNQNCRVDIQQDFSDFNLNIVSKQDLSDKDMVPIGVYIHSINSNFREKYKIIFEFNRNDNFVISLYRDFIEGNKGYIIKKYTVMFRDRNTGLGKILTSISKEITNDLVDA